MNKLSEPLVSIIIPAHNGEKHLPDAIRTILAQDYSHYEIWVIDNGSSDNTTKVIEQFPLVHYVCIDEANTAAARNKGITLAQGKYIAFLDQDDTWIPTKLTRQVRFLETFKEYSAVIGLQHIYLEEGVEKPSWLKKEFLEKPQAAYLPSALMVRREAFQSTGHFETQFSLTSDTAWFFKAKDQGMLIGEIPEPLIHRRVHADNASNKVQIMHEQMLMIIKASLAQRRKEQGV